MSIHEELQTGLGDRKLSRQAMVTMLLLIKNLSDYVCESSKRNSFGMLFQPYKDYLLIMPTIAKLLSTEHQDKIADFKEQFNRAVKQFTANVQMDTLQAVLDQSASPSYQPCCRRLLTVITKAHFFVLQELRPVFEACYDPEEGCLDGTRVELLSELMQWILNIGDAPNSTGPMYKRILTKNIVWLYGLAGSGKSTVVNTVAMLAEQQGLPVTSFCCKRDKQDSWCSVDRLFLMLAYQISKFNTDYRSIIVNVLRGPKQFKILRGVPDAQIEELFSKALSQLSTPLLPHVIVIDALDECAGPQAKVIKGLVAIAKAAPWIKILITSRDEDAIREAFREAPSDIYQDININDVQDVHTDIQHFTEHRLKKLKLDTDHAVALTRKAGGLFIWSSTVLRFLEGSHNPRGELETLVEEAFTPIEPLEELYKLYDKILEGTPYRQAAALTVMRRILGIVQVSSITSPLSANAISIYLQQDARFSKENNSSVERIVRALHAVLYQDGNGGAIRVYHPSFLDYLASKMKQLGWDAPSDIHRTMFEGSLSIMQQKLRFNICELEDASLFNKDVQDLGQRISRYIPFELRYSCQHWFTHLQQSGVVASEAGVLDTVSNLLCTAKILFWLEEMSVTDAVERCIPILQQCAAFFEVCG